MEEVKREVLVDVKVSGTENEVQVTKLTASILELQKANKELLEANKSLEKTGQDNTKAYVENAKQIEINKQKIGENTASRKGLIQAIIAEDNSIKSLSVRNAELIKQRNLINTSTDDGKKRIAAINAELNRNNKTIRENNDALGEQKINIGNYASALDRVVPGLGGMVSGIQGATKSALAFIATPLGAVLAGVVLALGTLRAAIKTDDETSDLFAKRWAQISSVFDVLIRRVGLLGKSLIALSTGEFREAAELAGKAVSGLNDELSDAVTLTGELQDRQNQLDDDLNKFHANETARQTEANRLRLEAKNTTLSQADAQKILNQASEVDRKLTEERTSLTQRQSDIDIESIGLKHNIQRQLNESTREYGNRLLENSQIGGEEGKKIAEALDKINQAQAQSILFQEKLQNTQDKLNESNSKNIEQLSEELALKNSLIELERIRDEERLEAYTLKLEQDIEADSVAQSIAENEIERQKQVAFNFDEATNWRIANLQKINALTEQYLKRGLSLEKAQAAAHKEIENEKLSITRDSLAASSSLFRKHTIAYKITASGAALIDTYSAATTAYKIGLQAGYPVGLVLGPVMAAIAIASGLANVAHINGIQFARGGILMARRAFGLGGISDTGGVLSGPSHAQGGIPFAVGGRLGFEAEGGEAIINKRSTQMYRKELSAINRAGGGVAFETGGITGNETRLALSASRQTTDFSQLVGQLNLVKPILVVDEVEAKQKQRYETQIIARAV